MEHKGETVGNGSWEAICTPDELSAVRSILAVPVVESAGKPPTTLLSGIARCVCGEVMHAHGQNWARVYRCSTHDATFGKTKLGEPHTAIKIEILDGMARAAVISSYFLNPAKTADTEAHTLAQLVENLEQARIKADKLLDLYLADELTKAAYTKKNDQLQNRIAQVEAAIAQKARSSAHAQMMTTTRAKLFQGHTVALSDAVKAKKELGEVFDALSIDDRRKLVAATVKLTVLPGRGEKRVAITGEGLTDE